MSTEQPKPSAITYRVTGTGTVTEPTQRPDPAQNDKE